MFTWLGTEGNRAKIWLSVDWLAGLPPGPVYHVLRTQGSGAAKRSPGNRWRCRAADTAGEQADCLNQRSQA
jgi:hypothetical protein